MELLILEEAQTQDLVQKTNNYMKLGWKILGTPYQRNHLVCLALTKGEYIRPARLKAKETE